MHIKDAKEDKFYKIAGLVNAKIGPQMVKSPIDNRNWVLRRREGRANVIFLLVDHRLYS